MDTKFTFANHETTDDMYGQARFTVIGVGGAGGNAVETMVQSGIKNVTFVCANTDKQALDRLSAPHKLQLGEGLGAGANPEVGREAAENDEERIRQLLTNCDMVFITAGMGGGTGTGAAPVVARLAKEMGVLTVAVVTMPFAFEGGKRSKIAKEGVEQLSNFVDSIITIPNDKLMSVYGKISMRDAFKKSDEVLLQAVQGISGMVDKHGYINIDFQDIRTAMQARGHAMMGIGRASGEDRAEQSTEKAIKSPLLDNLLLKNAKGLLVNVVVGPDFSLEEYQRITEKVESLVDSEDADIFYGVVYDENVGDEMHVTVVATGLTLDTTPRNATRAALATDTSVNTRVATGTHEAAYSGQRDTYTTQPATNPAPAYNQQPAAPQPQPAPQPAPAAPQRTGTSIQDYLRRQQNK